MHRNILVLAALSLLILSTLPFHPYTLHLADNTDWVNMAFALPIGLALALKFDLISNKNNRKK